MSDQNNKNLNNTEITPADSTEQELIRDWQQNGNTQSFYHLLHRHIKLLYYLIHGFKRYNLDQQDLFSEALIGFTRGLNKFDIKKGMRLSTYITWWIRGALYNFAFKNCFSVKIQYTKINKLLFYRLNSIKRDLCIEGTPSPDELEKISKLLNIKPKNILEMDFLLSGKNYSLDELSDNTENQSFFIDKKQDHQTDLLDKDNMDVLKHKLYEVINTLTQREKDILFYRQLYNPQRTLQFVADHLGISRERVRQLENNILLKLKNQLN